MEGYVAGLRQLVGRRLLLLPAVSVLIWDAEERLLLGRPIEADDWSTIGGAVEPGESPAQAAIREASEEIGCAIRIGDLRAVVGGPEYEVTYPNGDRCAYVTAVFDATLASGQPVADGEELAQLGWFSIRELEGIPLSRFARALLIELGALPGNAQPGSPECVSGPR